MAKNNTTKWLLLGLGAYVLYKYASNRVGEAVTNFVDPFGITRENGWLDKIGGWFTGWFK